jgi:hypothetical protein
MKAALLTVACVALLASTASAKNVKVYVFVTKTGATAGLLEGLAPAALMDSAGDVASAVNGFSTGLTSTTHRTEARIVVEVVGREEVQGEFRVHAQVTIDGRAVDVTGTSTHQWKHAAAQIVEQLEGWVKAHPDAK